MKSIRMTTRRWMIAIAILSPIFAVSAALYRAGQSLDRFYGPGGLLETQRRLSLVYEAASEASERGEYAKAEAEYRTALKLHERLESLQGGLSFLNSTPSLIGLADSLAGQGRLTEAESLYRTALSVEEDDGAGVSLVLVEALERYSAFLRRSGRAEEAIELEDRAIDLLDRHAASLRKDGHDPTATEARAEAIRARRPGASSDP
ncbi:tetratricopeptide repeat protein [Tautonia plasticadhaerens]|uniref:Tetratricopeptide repeat protein n=1 Tax=Tautonia plasticadhaerens TaxID=2527974 RepID=A0A518HCW4_9BACT|nr:tetratricopeptide repeat protein [Tautonia plasticadhaerens]QDV38704.1 Tetratricopeptide repeat protein [Tautonia plasticadhaerens]